MTSRFVIIGSGVASITAARTIAQTQPGANIEIYTADQYPYYSRPRLWEFLAGEIAQEDLYFYPPAWYKEQGIQVHLGSRVASLSPAQKEITLADGSVVPYDKLLLAMGSRSFVPPIPGADKQGVFTLRTVNDA
jgi:nitrite reductase (NADH) large subunit